MLRYLIKTLLQMNLFTDTLRDSNGTDLLYNLSIPTFNSSLLDWANFTGFNGQYTHGTHMLSFIREGYRVRSVRMCGSKGWTEMYKITFNCKEH
ncbi:hypothetical protein PGIGA_G00083840 [Pangasianodon gigas]|uniref:Uncharacterized protein n=1 Tax=Pangasianodon gigas TaxID=30993 RepID=A0ACC5XB46_PANGG|nr:hypothetical protein [Pangasianodon gigas]